MGKVKLYDIAKKLNLTSKEVLDVATKLNIEAKSHLSSISEGDAEKLEKALLKNVKKQEKGTENKGKMENKKEEKTTTLFTETSQTNQ